MAPSRPVIYQLVVRLFGNTNETNAVDGTLETNGCGRFADIDDAALAGIRGLGATHVWLTGVPRQATMTDYAALGLPADPPSVVKGRAGSFYAVRDYYDVCPDYARDPSRRMEELEALVARAHAAGLGVLVDLVPNHVARGYGSVVRPEEDFARGDDDTRFFARDNAFFYLVDPPAQALSLSKPDAWNPEGVAFDGRFDRESGGPGRVPRATGNNVTSPRPSATDWYETVKLNWGYHFVDPSLSEYEPVPRTWAQMDAIVAFWQSKGVDGFRVDFAHWVPQRAWRWLLDRARERREDTYFLAEAYEDLEGLLDAGFDAVYHDEAYDTLKRIYGGAATLDDLDALLLAIGDRRRASWAMYLENHDEKRIGAPVVRGGDVGASGFGSVEAGRQLAPVLYLAGCGPVLFYNGQEVGEDGMLPAGFGGREGRTSIFDYGAMPAFARWVNGGKYDGGRLTEDEERLRAYYADLLALCQAPEVRGAGYFGLRRWNRSWLFSFARFAPQAGSAIVVVANFAPHGRVRERIRLPRELLDAAGVSGRELTWRLLLDESGARDVAIARMPAAATEQEGFAADVAASAALVLRVQAS